jgi:hypothetical protein
VHVVTVAKTLKLRTGTIIVDDPAIKVYELFGLRTVWSMDGRRDHRCQH